MSSYKIITTRATLLDAQGYIQGRGLHITDHGDTMGIGAGEYRKDELEITAGEIRGQAGWSVTWDAAE